jgi:hypothetical protein
MEPSLFTTATTPAYVDVGAYLEAFDHWQRARERTTEERERTTERERENDRERERGRQRETERTTERDRERQRERENESLQSQCPGIFTTEATHLPTNAGTSLLHIQESLQSNLLRVYTPCHLYDMSIFTTQANYVPTYSVCTTVLHDYLYHMIIFTT